MEPTTTRIRDRFGRFMSRSEVQTEVAETEVAETEAQQTPREEPIAPEQPKTHWEEKGFGRDTANLSFWFEEMEPSYLYTPRIRHIIQVLENSNNPADLDYISSDDLREYRRDLRDQVPRVERDITTFVSSLARARAVQDDHIDYI